MEKEPLDIFLRPAAELIVSTGDGSTSMIQRKFGIHYDRSKRIMNQLEHHGIVGPPNEPKKRKVLVTTIQDLHKLLPNEE